jgi:type IX secretion system substrate protein
VLVDQIYEDGHPVAITCHHGPDASYDDYSHVDAAGRISDLGVNLYPTLLPDGQPEPTYPYSYAQLVGVINDRMAIPSPCSMVISGQLVGNDLTVNVSVLKDDGAEMPNARVQVVVTELYIPYDNPSYNNQLNFVNRDMILDHNGTELTFYGNSAEVSITGTLDPTWVQDNIVVVAFVEDGNTLNVYQASREDIEIFLADPNAPAQPTDFVGVPDPGGSLSCDLSWTNPSTTFSGQPLTDLVEMRLYRDAELIYTDTDPVIGGAGSFYDEVEMDGSYAYSVVAFNTVSEGPPATLTTWIGEDVPNVVNDLTLEDQGGAGYLTWTNPTTGLNGGAFNQPIMGYHITRSDGVTFELDGIFTDYTDNNIPGADYYDYTVTPFNAVGDGGTVTSNIVWIGNAFSGIVILDFDPTPTGDVLQASIENFYDGSVVVTNDVNEYPLTSDVEAVFVLLGIFSDNFTLTETEGSLLATYIDGGGNVYMEGGDTWYYDSATTVHPYFNITGISDGAFDGDLTSVTGHDFLDGMSWDYSGENSYIDNLGANAPAVPIFSNTTVGYDCGIAYDEGTYRTIGSSFEITGLGGTNTLDDAVSGVLDFFEVGAGQGDYFSEEFETEIPADWTIYATNPDFLYWFEGRVIIFRQNAAAPPLMLVTPELDLSQGETVIFEAGEQFGDPQGRLGYLTDQADPGTFVLIEEFSPNTPMEEYSFDISNITGPGYLAWELETTVFSYFSLDNVIIEAGSGTDAEEIFIPEITELGNNYPNPFNPETTINYGLKANTYVTLEVYNIKGQLVRTLVNNNIEAGNHKAVWEGLDDNRNRVSSGVYFYKLNTGDYTSTKKMILLK